MIQHLGRASLGGLLVFALSAASAPHLPQATEFFRFPAAPLASGQAARSLLEKTLKRTELDPSFHLQWNNKKYIVNKAAVVTEQDCLSLGRLKENSALLSEPASNGIIRRQLERKTEVRILDTKQNWARVRVGKQVGWLPLHRLEPLADDPGVYISLVDTYIRKAPGRSSDIRSTLPKGTRIQVTGFFSGWFRFTHENKSYFVDADHFVGRPDFALWAWKKSKEWVPVTHREGTFLRTKSGDLISLTYITAFNGNTKKAIVLHPEEGATPPLRAHAEIQRKEVTLWAVSDLPGHGTVWWKQNREVETEAPGRIPTEELLKRKIFSYALVGSKDVRGLISADGVWRTTDGQYWEKIPSFEEQNVPVAIHSDGTWFAGAFKSEDEGRTFQPFIKWDELAKTLEAALSRRPRYLRLQKIEPLPESRLRVLVDTGVRRVSLRTHLDGDSWQIMH